MSSSLRKLFLAIGGTTLVFSACHQTQQKSQPEVSAEVVQPAEPAKSDNKPRTQATPRRQVTAAVVYPKVVPSAEPFVPQAPKHRVARVEVPGPYVALTFDDGPNPATTPKILDILRRHGVHATFFVAGENAVNNKKILARAAAEGNEIGAHTYSHIRMTGCSEEKITSEMTRTNAIIEAATGRKPVVMRPPYGATNARLVEKMYNDYGMHSILWDVDTQDWRHPGVDVVVRRAVGNARAGSIILVHDIHASTLAAVDDIVTGLKARGFKLVTVSQLIALGTRAAAPVEPAAETEGGETAAAPQTQPESTEPALPAASTTAQPAPETQEEPGKPTEETTPGSASISVGSAEQ